MSADLEFLSFKIGEKNFALETKAVESSSMPLPFEKVPLAPAFVIGVCNLRGRVVPLFDFSKLLKLKSSKTADTSRFLIVKHLDREMIFMVDSLGHLNRGEVEKLSDKDQEQASSDGYSHLLNGLYKNSDQLIHVINTERLFGELL